jgi:hypothetical protein
MGGFQKIVILILLGLLIIILLFVGLSLSNTNKKTWPPIVGDCPDFWLDSAGDGSKCENIKDLGTCNGGVTPGKHLIMDFTVAPYNGTDSLCKKYTWANGCGLNWDGVTNLSSNPCLTK